MDENSDATTGHCLCGEISLSVEGRLDRVLHCHCENCRRISGNFVAAARVSNEHLQVSDPNDNLGWHEFPYARYGFCRRCGSTMFFVPQDRDHVTSVMVGVLDNVGELPLGEIWFANEAHAHNFPLSDVPQFEGNN